MMNEIERKILDKTMHERDESRKECERLRAELAAERKQRQYTDDTLRVMWEQLPEQPAETELEQKAWQAFLAATAAACNHLSPAGAFQEAKDWIIHRNFRRKNKIT